jgi:hypothetical protein
MNLNSNFVYKKFDNNYIALNIYIYTPASPSPLPTHQSEEREETRRPSMCPGPVDSPGSSKSVCVMDTSGPLGATCRPPPPPRMHRPRRHVLLRRRGAAVVPRWQPAQGVPRRPLRLPRHRRRRTRMRRRLLHVQHAAGPGPMRCQYY